MAYSSSEDRKPTITGQELKDFLEKSQKRLKMCVDADNHNRTEAIADLKFINGEMWDTNAIKERDLDRRPHLQINLLNKYRNQLVGEQRNNRVRIKVRPLTSDADVETAKIYAGIIANTEYISNYKQIYNFAYDQCVDCGYGGWEVLTRYTEENPFEQEAYLALIKNPFLMYLDPEDEADPKFGYVLTKMNRDVFMDKYPGAETPDDVLAKGQGLSNEHWYDKNTVTVARYYVKEPKKKRKALLNDGRVLDEKEANEIVSKWKKTLKDAGAETGAAPTIVKTREVEEYKVKCYIITAFEILEEYEWPGSIIPLVLLTGRERNIEGKKYVRGFIRDAKDPQKLFNYWLTSGAEHIALAPKSPWQATAKQIEGYEGDYLSSNTRNIPVLKYKHDPQAATAMPTRQAAPQPPVAIFQAIQDARQNIQDAIGMTDRDTEGKVGPERSGAAIKQSQVAADIGTYDIFDNFKLAIEKTGRILVDMIPNVIDNARDVRVRNVDDTEQFVPVNTSAGEAMRTMQQNPGKFQGMDLQKLKTQMQQKGPGAQYNNLKAGKYGVVVDTGPSTATQRQEAAEHFMQLLGTPMGEMVTRVAPDLVIKNFDFLEADEFAKRVKKMLPPGIAEPKPGEQPTPPLPPPPQVQLMMQKTQTEQAKQQTQRIAMQVQLAKLYKETKESDSEMRSTILKMLNELFSPQHPSDLPEDTGNAMPQMQQQHVVPMQ